MEAGFFDSVFAGALGVGLVLLEVLLLVSAFLDSDLVAVVLLVLLELLALLSLEARESVR